jgi:hypothetical protein
MWVFTADRCASRQARLAVTNCARVERWYMAQKMFEHQAAAPALEDKMMPTAIAKAGARGVGEERLRCRRLVYKGKLGIKQLWHLQGDVLMKQTCILLNARVVSRLHYNCIAANAAKLSTAQPPLARVTLSPMRP